MAAASAPRRFLRCLLRTCLGPRRGLCEVSQAGTQPDQPPSPASSLSSEELIAMEYQHCAHNYHPFPMVFSRAKGSSVWDPEGNKYTDLLSAYSAVSQGHCHPKVMEALVEQAGRLTLSSRAFYNDKFPLFAELVTRMFGYDMVLPMNTGAEGVETALKLARKWGYEKKKIPKDEAIIVSCCGCSHGRTLAVISMSCDNDAACGFGPLLPGHMKVDFGDKEGLEQTFREHGDKIAAFLFEPIQGEAGVIIPPDGYITAVRDLCSRYNILMIADEIQTGLGRTGKMLACDWEEVHPDVLILGKALGGGVIPVSAVLADKDIMLCIKPGEHGSTFGGNPLASAVAIASLNVIKDERLAHRADEVGDQLRLELMRDVKCTFSHIITNVRGRGLLNAIELDDRELYPASAYDICVRMKEKGILAKPTHGNIIRLAPPLSIRFDEMSEVPRVLYEILRYELSYMKEDAAQSERTAPPEQPCHRCGQYLYSWD